MTWTDSDRSIVRRYPKAIAHLWRQRLDNRSGLVIGSGVNRALGFPDWGELVKRIANHDQVQAADLLTEFEKTPLPILTQILLHHYRRRQEQNDRLQGRNERDTLRLVAAGFRDLMHECLYRGVPANDDELEQRDSFYKHFLPVIRQSPMTVVYNFDDTVERLLLRDREKRGEGPSSSRGFETVTDGRQQFRLSQAVIYHPNGYLPRNLIEPRGDTIVFTDETLADQLIGSMAGEYATLLNHLSKQTCLLVGLSLDDSTLRHILRQSAKMNPGHFHYYVKYVERMPAESELDSGQLAQASANFEVLNLITLYLDAAGVASLGKLLASSADDLRSLAEEEGARLWYCYYVTGVPGVGKTTAVSHFKSLVTFDEWLAEQPAQMGAPWQSLSAEDRKLVDDWVKEQVGLKNRALLDDYRDPGIGIVIVDRCISDPVTFTPLDERPQKAKDLLSSISPGKSNRKAQGGVVLLLVDEPAELVVRARCAGKTPHEEATRELQCETEMTYGADAKRLDTSDMSIEQVARALATTIHRDDYPAYDLDALLRAIADGSPAPAR